MQQVILLIILCFSLASCNKQKNNFEVKDFKPLTNWTYKENNIKTIYLDYSNAISNGFVIPTINQVKGGRFIFSFSIKNIDNKPERFYYKIFYQNESYKFQEQRKDSSLQNPLASENFYGSWENTSKTFASTTEIPADGAFHEITDSVSIVGNPRNEERFYGAEKPFELNEKDVKSVIVRIKSDSNWLKSIIVKAKKENRTLNEQLKLDAAFILKEEYDHSKPVTNNRWKRNPRVGKYSFMLVVSDKENLDKKKIPDYIGDISLKNGNDFVNPYYYFLSGWTNAYNDIKAMVSEDSLKVIAKPDLGKGIYVSPYRIGRDSFNMHYFNSNCSDSPKMYAQAPFEQYLSITRNLLLNNYPLTADVEGNAYTMADYMKNKFSEKQLIKTTVKNTDCPCATVKSDTVNHVITLKNPASKPGKWVKEDVGVMTRNGFTYGKYFVKIKLPKLLNKTNVWDGLTNSIWLLSQIDPWNTRRPSKTGYLPVNVSNAGPATPKTSTTTYSEIDFEILKAAHYWPKSSYNQGTKHIPEESPNDSDKIMVTYTNWDMGCRDVQKYVVGVDSIAFKGNYYTLHRWDHFNQNMTGKDAESDNELFGGEYYYFEIEWNPQEIIWRIGPEKNKMKVIGYMNDSLTSVPNNQMVLVITKEFHYSAWWPGLPMPQETIPFPAKDIEAKIYEITVE